MKIFKDKQGNTHINPQGIFLAIQGNGTSVGVHVETTNGKASLRVGEGNIVTCGEQSFISDGNIFLYQDEDDFPVE